MHLYLLLIVVQLPLVGMPVNILQHFILQLQVLSVSIIQQIHVLIAAWYQLQIVKLTTSFYFLHLQPVIIDIAPCDLTPIIMFKISFYTNQSTFFYRSNMIYIRLYFYLVYSGLVLVDNAVSVSERKIGDENKHWINVFKKKRSDNFFFVSFRNKEKIC